MFSFILLLFFLRYFNVIYKNFKIRGRQIIKVSFSMKINLLYSYFS